jgi:hypothetical protein
MQHNAMGFPSFLVSSWFVHGLQVRKGKQKGKPQIVSEKLEESKL